MAAVAPFRLDNSYARDLQGFSVPWRPEAVPAPKSLFFNAPLAEELGLDAAALAGEAGAALFAGNAVPEGAEPIAQAYAGHQFGGFSPQLGDGRALLLGEVIDRAGRRRDIAFKGSGRTPFSRGGDGKAAVGPMLREVLIGEAMHALGIPTTRALAVVATGEPVLRETVLPGAVLTRVAASHIRVGTFQFFAARGDVERVRQLAEYTIARHDPDLVGAPGRFLALLERVAERQAALIAQWMNVGFIHGVMNTDNMTISGETIDYGPCAFVEAYDPAAVFSSIDSQRPLRLRQPAAHRALEPGAPGRDAAAAARRRRRSAGDGRRPRAVIDAFPGALSPPPAARPARQARPARARRRRRRRRRARSPTTGSRCCTPAASTSRSPGAASPTPPTATTRRCARCSLDADARPTPGSRAGASAARATTKARAGGAGAAPKRAPSACAASTPGSSRATTASRKRSPRRRDDDDLGPFERLLAALRRPFDESAEPRALRRAGAGRGHGRATGPSAAPEPRRPRSSRRGSRILRP